MKSANLKFQNILKGIFALSLLLTTSFCQKKEDPNKDVLGQFLFWQTILAPSTSSIPANATCLIVANGAILGNADSTYKDWSGARISNTFGAKDTDGNFIYAQDAIHDGTSWFLGEALGIVKSNSSNGWQTLTRSHDYIYGIATSGGTTIGVGRAGLILRSTNGTTASDISATGVSPNNLSTIAVGNGTWVAGGNLANQTSFNSSILYSTNNGTNWTASTNNKAMVVVKIIYANSMFVAVGGSGIISTSTDGITWTIRTGEDSSFNFSDIAFGNGIFVAVGTTSTQSSHFTSTDGITWTKSNRVLLRSISYDSTNATFVGVQPTSASNSIYTKVSTSKDGLSWSNVTTSFGISETIFLGKIRCK
ncbi:hypothetical protein EHQ58_16655 [Leptospira ognonensis]|uniref:Exo-alpha-sialidase n=1 Tax=Leptospira ognonensis TaxID=2484945 RepID=A0A4R9JW65_9LEPT|nr:hypothetical protein [Leptospira ognonensis]TGL56264.1 hypothetical protein EHQ58_16655 [Leptospira ognonensis]